MREYQFDELCGLRQITVSWANSYKYCITYHMVYESLPYIFTAFFGLIPQPISHACLDELAERSIHVVVMFEKRRVLCKSVLIFM